MVSAAIESAYSFLSPSGIIRTIGSSQLDNSMQGRNQIVLNLARVAYIGSSGLGEFIAGQVTLNNKGGRIKLLNLTQRLQELMTIAKLLTMFEVYEDESRAINSSKTRVAIAVPAVPGMASAPMSNS